MSFYDIGLAAAAPPRRSFYRAGLDAALGWEALVGSYKSSADPLIRRVAQAVRNVAPEFGFPPQPTDRFVTAHAITSTGWFDDDLSQLHNGIFGMKAGRHWTGPVALMKTGEWYSPEEVARAQAIPDGQRGSFIRYADDKPPDARGKRKVFIWDAFRKYPSADDAIRDHFRLLTGASRYARSIEKLRAGAPDYMRQLGLDGWYTGDPDVTQATWSSIANGSRLRDILAAGGGNIAQPDPTPGPTPARASWIAPALGVGVGVAAVVAAAAVARR